MVEIYALCCPDTGDVRYIGKANNAAKRLKSHVRDARRRRTPVYDWMMALAKVGKIPALRVLVQTEDWRAEERRLIAEYRAAGARLLNLADGGDEPYCPPEVRAENGRRSGTNRKKLDPLQQKIIRIKQILGSALKRGHLREETKEKMREASRLRPDLWHWSHI